MSRWDEYDEEHPRAGFWSTLVNFSSWALSLVAVGLVGAFFLIIDTQRPGPAAANGAPITNIVVPRGAGLAAIGEHLQAEGVVRSAIAFRGATVLYGKGRTLKAGEYAIPSRASVGQVIEMLAQGKVLLHPITVPEGWTSGMIVEMLAASDVLDGPAPPEPAEGSLLPETYAVERGATRAAVLQQMRDAHVKVLEALWPKRAPNLPVRTPQEAVTLASIVEKETALDAERPRVAAVYINRLRKGMKLESDPTVIYGVSQGRALGRGILQSELNRETPYNTYRVAGLPPTPIANPGKASLAAVLNPPATNELYFVADGAGGHVFAATYSEHQRNVARWRAIERSRASQ